ncbi:hypothetical protein BT96DRAFT_999136 [Gymnopus androsaceus JB14]|uniref:Uncharacterized protein n=1 Tax=Gymnopus androsaceus JB14 TaxID=1447944 RepID=A0A6A4H7U2_9AGAR|nr:hypothetical protein BT96DRAFT_999136 [Gymnopus androsaceus JB14]
MADVSNQRWDSFENAGFGGLGVDDKSKKKLQAASLADHSRSQKSSADRMAFLLSTSTLSLTWHSLWARSSASSIIFLAFLEARAASSLFF